MESGELFIVDDDQMMADMLKDRLSEECPYEVSVYNTGEDCLANLSKNPRVVVLDYHLDSVVPGAEDGMKILEKIKAQDENICVIMLSSQEQYGTALQTIVKGALEYVVKDENAFDNVISIVKGL